MFNELTLALHILLLVSIYVFLLATVRVIAKDLSSSAKAKDRRLALEVDSEQQTAKLVASGAGQSGQIYTINEQISIGRAPDCDIILQDNFTSAHHARVYQASNAYWLEDLGSTNGTLLGKTPVKGPVKLKPGSEFRIGEAVFRFVS